jgi:Tfp pilus assembly protein FimT
MILQTFKRTVSDNSGFTVADIMAALVVFGIVTAVAVPSYVSLQPGFRLNGAARQVLAKLMWARSKAVEQNSPYGVTYPTPVSFQIFNDTNDNGSLDAGELVQDVGISNDYPGVAVSQSGADPIFNSRGTANSGTTEITISNTSGTRTVTVTATGNVRIN